MRRPVYDYTHVPVDFPSARELLAGDPGSWLPAPATPDGDGWLVTLRADGLIPAPGVDTIVAVDRPTVDRDKLLVRPLTWRAAAADRLFPTLTADLEVEGINGSAIRLTLVGSYRPPVSVVGGAADRLVGHHVAEATVRGFLERIATHLSATTTESPPTLIV